MNNTNLTHVPLTEAQVLSFHAQALAASVKDLLDMAIAWSAHWQYSAAYGNGLASRDQVQAIAAAQATLKHYERAIEPSTEVPNPDTAEGSNTAPITGA